MIDEMSMFYTSEGGRKDKTKINRIFNRNLRFKFETHFINFFSLTRKQNRSTRNLIQLDMVDSNGVQKELTVELYEVGNSQVQF